MELDWVLKDKMFNSASSRLVWTLWSIQTTYLTQTIWCFINQHFKTDFWQKASVKTWDLDWSTHTSQQLLQTPRLAFVHLLPLFNSFLSSEPEGISRLIELSRCSRPILHVLLEIKVRASPVGWRPELDWTSQQKPDLEPKFDKTHWTRRQMSESSHCSYSCVNLVSYVSYIHFTLTNIWFLIPARCVTSPDTVSFQVQHQPWWALCVFILPASSSWVFTEVHLCVIVTATKLSFSPFVQHERNNNSKQTILFLNM